MSDPEPPLALGDTGEWVLRLQTRLHALGLLDGPLDGSFGDATKVAVTQLQEHNGVLAGGDVDQETWAALARAEQQAGRPDPEDQQWHWDGERWQPKDENAVAADDRHHDLGRSQVSPDGQWLWDGNQWQPATT
jgi:hypothetical protein